MATTKVWKIKNRLDNSINYIINPEKTLNKKSEKKYLRDIHNSTNDFENEKTYWVTGINCSDEDAYSDMMLTKIRYYKKDGLQGFHAYQSFKPNEVTAKLAHEIGVQTATEMWGDKYEILVATHQNTNCIHNHFILNSVSFKDGYHYRNTDRNIALFRETSDSICEEYGLSVIKEYKNPKNNYFEKCNKNYVASSEYHQQIKNDLDYAIRESYQMNTFFKILESKGYIVTVRSNKISIRKEPYKRNIRLEKTFGDDYSIQRIGQRLYDVMPLNYRHESKRRKHYTSQKQTFKKMPKLSLLFILLCIVFRVNPFKNQQKKYPQKLSKFMQKEVKKMEQISKETRYLVKNNVTSSNQLKIRKDELKLEIDVKEKEINKLKYKLKTKTLTETEITNLNNEIETLYAELTSPKEELRLINSIFRRIPEAKEKLDNLKVFNKYVMYQPKTRELNKQKEI